LNDAASTGLASSIALGLVAAPSALAGKPTGEYAVFKDCPLGTTGVNQCVYVETTGGELKIGSVTTPISHTIMLQGGLIVTEKEGAFVAPAKAKPSRKRRSRFPEGSRSKGSPKKSQERWT
jgi:hypothetical protein